MSAALAESMRRISGLLQAGRFDEAQSQLAALLEANPDYVEGLRLLAGTKQVMGDFAMAESLLQRALRIDPGWTPTLTALAQLLLTSGRSAEALPLLQRAVEGLPPYPRAAYLLARYYLDAGQPAAAFDAAAPWCGGAEVDPDLAELHVTACAALGRQREAVAHYRRLAALYPSNDTVMHTLAIALNAAEQADESERVARQTLQCTRPTAALYHTHARSLMALERFDQAEQALRDCVKLAPTRAEAHDSLAQLIWMRSGDIGEATRVLDQALERYAHDDALWATKAALLQGAGDAHGAYACLMPRVVRPQAPPMLLLRAGLAALEFDPATALMLAQKVLRAQPDNPTTRKLLCAAYLGVGDATAASAECASLLAATPDDQYLIAMQATALRLSNDSRYETMCNYDTMVLSQTLETPPGWSSLDRFLADLSASLAALHNPQGHRQIYQSLRRGTETTRDLSRSEDPIIQALFAAFAAPIARYRAHIGQGQDALRRRNQGAARFNGSWSVRLHSAGYHTSHVHPRGWISSACYIQLPVTMRAAHTGEGALSFGTPGMMTTPGLGAELSVQPAVGQLILFPSYFWHGTLPFHSTQPRLTVAFDVVPSAR